MGELTEIADADLEGDSGGVGAGPEGDDVDVGNCRRGRDTPGQGQSFQGG